MADQPEVVAAEQKALTFLIIDSVRPGDFPLVLSTMSETGTAIPDAIYVQYGAHYGHADGFALWQTQGAKAVAVIPGEALVIQNRNGLTQGELNYAWSLHP